MLKLVFGSIIVVFCLGLAFALGFVLGSTMTPLQPADTAASAAAIVSVIGHG